jgi:HlyD family secretion protein
MRTKGAIAVALLAAAGAGGYAFYARGRAPHRRWQTAKVVKTSLTAQVTATGTVQPTVTSPVGAQVSGIVWKIHADFNERVTEGQVLVELDPALFKNAVAQAEANLATAIANQARSEASLVDARRIRDRDAQLVKDHYVAQSDYDTAEANLAGAEAALGGAKATVIQSRAQLARARLDLEHSVVRSPVTGTVISRNIDLGQAVAASFTAPTLFTIAKDLSLMEVHASIDEADIGQVRQGEQATFTVDAYRGEKFKAMVKQVRNAAQTVQNVVTYDVVMAVDNSDLRLKPGMTANVSIVSATHGEALAVPNAALRFKPPVDAPPGEAGREPPREKKRDERPAVYVPDGEQAKRTPVEIGISDGTLTEVKGVTEGQEVVVDVVKDAKAAPQGRAFGPRF